MEKKTVIIQVETEEGVKNLDRLEAKFDEVYGEILPLTGAIGELEDQLYEMAKRGEQGTDEFKALAAEAGRLKKTIQQVDMEVDALSMTTANKLGGALGGVTSGFELAQGAMGAMGAESEKVQEALLAVQSAMAMAQGIQGVKEALPAFKALGGGAISAFQGMTSAGKAFAVTGIGLILTALAAAVAAMEAFSDATEEAAKKEAQLEKEFEKTNKQIESQSKLTETLSQLSDDLYREELINAKKRGASEAELTKIKRDGAKDRIRILEDEEAELLKIYEKKSKYGSLKEIIAAEEAWLKAVQASKDARMALEEEEADESLARQREAAEKAAEARKEAAEKRKAEQEAEAEAAAQRRKEQADLEQYFVDQSDVLRQQEADSAKALEDKKNADAEAAAQFRAEIYAWETQKALEEDAKKEENRKKSIEAWKAMEEGGFQFINDLADLFAGKDEASQRRAFKVKKAAGIAQATIDTYQAAAGAYKSQMTIPTPDAPVRAAIAAAFAVASGLARIKAIASTKFEGGGGVSAGGGGSTPPAATSSPAQFNIVGNSGTNQLLETMNNQTVKAYVVGGDVTSAQSLERNKIQTASL